GSPSAILLSARSASNASCSTATRLWSSSARLGKFCGLNCLMVGCFSTTNSTYELSHRMIELIHLFKHFGELVAVNDITLTVPRGEFFAVLGPNAAGKTTTIKMLAGLIKPTSGSARIGGFDVQTQPLEARKRLAYVPDFPFLYEKLTPWEFFRFMAQIFEMNEEAMRPAVQELVRRFNLAEFVNKPVEGLSHGTRQRIAIVAALMHDPEVFII